MIRSSWRYRALNTIRRRFRSARPSIYAAPRKELYCHNYLTAILESRFGEQRCAFRDSLAGCRMVEEKFPLLSIFLLSWPWFNAIGLIEFATETN